jgi:hypothetical protein
MSEDDPQAGLSLFLRYAEGCRMYLEDKGLINDKDRKELDTENPAFEVLRKVFYVAIPVMEKIAESKGKDVFDIEVLREFYSTEHNERKFGEGELICIAYPARVIERRKHGNENGYLIELEPVKGLIEISSDLDLKPGDWAVMHRINLVEQIPEAFALEMADKLRKLGLDKTFKFPKVAIKYLKKLKSGFNGTNKKNQGPSDEGKGEASPHPGGSQEDADQGSGEAYA